MLPINTATILQFLGYQPLADYSVTVASGAVESLQWISIAPQPTEQEIIDAGNSAAFATWLAENGGDPVLTRRRKARDRVVSSDDLDIRALILNANRRCNYLVARVEELQAALLAAKASTGAVQNMRDALPASYLATNARDLPTAIQDYQDDIAAGDAD